MSYGSPARVTIREEQPADADAIRAVVTAAFGQPDEALLVDRLRASLPDGGADGYLALVAACEGAVVGHVAFSPVSFASEEGTGAAVPAVGLAPMAVRPDLQCQGIGTALVEAGLEACRTRGVAAVVVLGHPAYYPRFGFVPARRFGLRMPYDVPPEAAMALELAPGSLADASGVVHYHPAFGSIS